MRSVLVLVSALVFVTLPAVADAQTLLVPMDGQQGNHLRAYGLVYQSIAAGEPIEIDSAASIADGLRPAIPGNITYQVCAALVDEMITVTEAEIAEAVRFLLARAKILVEPSGAVGIAALLHKKLPDTPVTAGTILTGGNADFEVLARVLRNEV